MGSRPYGLSQFVCVVGHYLARVDTFLEPLAQTREGLATGGFKHRFGVLVDLRLNESKYIVIRVFQAKLNVSSQPAPQFVKRCGTIVFDGMHLPEKFGE